VPRLDAHGLGREQAVVMTDIIRRSVDPFRTKANRALDRAEDQREALDHAYRRQPARG
jgi:hypothetical protein